MEIVLGYQVLVEIGKGFFRIFLFNSVDSLVHMWNFNGHDIMNARPIIGTKDLLLPARGLVLPVLFVCDVKLSFEA